MNREFIEELQKSSFFPYLFEENDVVLIYLGGSRAFGEHSEESDYDIVVLTKNKALRKEGLFGLEYKGRKVHGYYKELFELFLPITEEGGLLEPISTVNLLTVSDNIIYANPKYQKEVDYILQYSKELAKIGAGNFLIYNNIYNETLSEQTPPKTGKTLYHIYNSACIALDKEIDVNFGKGIKETHGQRSEELLNIINNINTYYTQHEKDIKKNRNDFLNKLKEV